MSVETNNVPDDPAELKLLLLEQQRNQQQYQRQLTEQQRLNTVLEHGI